MADDMTTPDLSALNPSGMQAATNGSDTAALQPTFSASGISPNIDFTYQGLHPDQIQEAMLPFMGELAKQFDPSSEKNQMLAKHLDALTYGPEQRAQDLYNKAFGIKTKPVVDQNGNPVGEPAKVGHDWLRFGLQNVGELGRAIQSGVAVAHGGQPYTPAIERFRDQALKEYTAEATPAVRELLYENQNQRAAMGDLQRMFGTLNLSQQRAAQLSVAQTRQNIAAYHDLMIDPARKQELAALTNKALTETDVEKQNVLLKQIETQYKEETGGLTGMPGMAHQIDYYKSHGQADRAASLQQIYDKELQTQAGGRAIQLFTDANNNPMAFDKITRSITPLNSQQNSGLSPEDAKATRAYYGGAATAGTAEFKSPLPPELTSEERAIVGTIPLRGKLTGDDARRANAAERGYQNAQDLKQILGNMNDTDMGTFVGRMNQFLQGTSEADPQWTSFWNKSGILGANHSAAQAFRNAQFVEAIQKSIANFGTNKKSIMAAIQAYEDTFTESLADFPQLKARPFARNMDPVEAIRVFHPDIYKNIQQRISDKLKQGNKQ